MAHRAAACIAALCAHAEAPQSLRDTCVVVAHPDDETTGAGSRLPRLREARFVYVTDGAPRDGRDAARHGLSVEAYAQLRRRELEGALALCGVPPDGVLHLGWADQQAAAHMALIARQLVELFTNEAPDVVLTHPYEGGHPDHDATAFAVHAAVASLRQRQRTGPEIVEMASYHLGPEGIRPCTFLPHAGSAVATVKLDRNGQELRRALLACHASQQDTLRYFASTVERFRPAPVYDFTRPPHAGELFYERHRLGLTGAQFRAQAAQALAELELAVPL
jgi:LmbE family N-acetylglucosaminyl deacetylase